MQVCICMEICFWALYFSVIGLLISYDNLTGEERNSTGKRWKNDMYFRIRFLVDCDICIETIYFLIPKAPPHRLIGQICKTDKQDHQHNLENPHAKWKCGSLLKRWFKISRWWYQSIKLAQPLLSVGPCAAI